MVTDNVKYDSQSYVTGYLRFRPREGRRFVPVTQIFQVESSVLCKGSLIILTMAGGLEKNLRLMHAKFLPCVAQHVICNLNIQDSQNAPWGRIVHVEAPLCSSFFLNPSFHLP
jgi:hypothetical protein